MKQDTRECDVTSHTLSATKPCEDKRVSFSLMSIFSFSAWANTPLKPNTWIS